MLVVVIFFVFGLVFGSFYNVVGIRLSENKSIIKPGSSCMKCGYQLKWYDLIPVFSYLFLKGKCRKCKESISLMYPIVELLTGILFAVSYYSFGFSYDLVIALIISSLFSIVIVSDLNYLIIPDQVLLISGILIAIINLLNYGLKDGLLAISNGVIMFLIMLLIMKFGNFVFKKESLGGGDIKLMFVLGMTLPFIINVFSIFLASVIALPIALVILVKNKNNILPFGPFLVAGNLICLFLKLDAIKLYSILTNLL